MITNDSNDFCYANASYSQQYSLIRPYHSLIYGFLNDMDLSQLNKRDEGPVSPPSRKIYWILGTAFAVVSVVSITYVVKRFWPKSNHKPEDERPTQANHSSPGNPTRNITPDLLAKLNALKPLTEKNDVDNFCRLLESQEIKIPPKGSQAGIYEKIRAKFPIQQLYSQLEAEVSSIREEDKSLERALQSYHIEDLSKLKSRWKTQSIKVYRIQHELRETNILTHLNYVTEQLQQSLAKLSNLSTEALASLGADLKQHREMLTAHEEDIKHLRNIDTQVKVFEESWERMENWANARRQQIYKTLTDTLQRNSILVKETITLCGCIKVILTPVNYPTKNSIYSFLNWLEANVSALSLEHSQTENELNQWIAILNRFHSDKLESLIHDDNLWQTIQGQLNGSAEPVQKASSIHSLLNEFFNRG